MLKDTQNTHCSLTQCCAKPQEGMSGSDDKDWASRLATNIK